MFQNLTDRLSRVVKTMRGQARLTEENTAEMLREVRLALLEADVALPVVKELIKVLLISPSWQSSCHRMFP